MNRPLVCALALTALVPGAWCATSAAAATGAAPKPKIGTVSVSHDHLSGHGGKVTVAARLARAKRCRLTVKPAVKGLPKHTACSGKSVSWRVSLPASQSATATSYRFTITAVGAGHRVVTKKRTVVEAPTTQPPHISSLKQSAQQLTSNGGPVTVSAITPRAKRCELKVSRPVLGMPQIKPCTSGKVTWTTTLPPNDVATPAGYTFSVKAVGSSDQLVQQSLPPVTVAAQSPTCPGQTSVATPKSATVFNDPSTGEPQDQNAIVNDMINLICDVSPPVGKTPARIDLAMYIYQLPNVSDALKWAHEYRGADVHVILDGDNKYVANPDGSAAPNPAYDNLLNGADSFTALPAGSVLLCGANAGREPPPPGDGDEPTIWAPQQTGCAGEGILHTKMLLVSSVDTRGDPVVLTTSQNLDTNAEVAAFNDGIQIVGNGPIYAANRTYANRLIADQQKTDPDLGDQLGDSTTMVGTEAITPMFFPRNDPAGSFPANNSFHRADDTVTDPIPKLLDRVACTNPGAYAGDHSGATAQTLVEIAMWDYSSRTLITEALENLASHGCQVKVIYGEMTSAVKTNLTKPNITLVELNDQAFPYSNGSGSGHVFTHDKLLMISGAVKPTASGTAQPNLDIVQAGSVNYTQSSLHFNDEQDFTVQQAATATGSPPVFTGYQQNFTHLWQVASSVSAPTTG